MDNKIEEQLALLLAEQRTQTDLMRRALTAVETLTQQLVGRLPPGAATGSPRVVELRKR